MTSGLLTPSHIAILLVILLMIFGAKRLPETGRALGRSMREFKDAIAGRDETATTSEAPNLTQTGQHPETTNGPRQPTSSEQSRHSP